jgi:hypothetical protein
VAIDVFAEKYGAKYDKAVECLIGAVFVSVLFVNAMSY